MLTQRQMCILTLLSEQSLPCGQIAESLSVSPGTVRNDLRQIQEYLEKTGRGSIISTPGVGFSLHSSQRCAGQHDTGRGFQISERSFYIGMRLLQVRPGEAVTETKLSEELYISRSSVSRALESLQELLSRFDLTIEKKKNQGILLAGDEFNKRLAWAQLCRSHMTGKGEKHREWSHRDFGEPQEWEKILPGIELDRIDRLIRRLEGEYDPIDEAEKYLELFIHLGLSLYRSSKKYRICLKKRPQLVQQLEEMRGFMERLDVIWQEEMDRFLPREEKEYIGICILFSGILKSSAMDYQRRRLLSSPEFQAFFREFTQVMREVCAIDLSREQQMQEAFCYHVSGLIFRMKNGLRTKNPLLKEIRRTYPSIYGASWFSSILFEKYFGIVVTDDEIAYLTTYLAAAKERARPFITACVVCNYGVSVSQLLCERLRRVIPEIEIVDILPRKKFEELSRRGEIETSRTRMRTGKRKAGICARGLLLYLIFRLRTRKRLFTVCASGW